jgi:hypothetical protein
MEDFTFQCPFLLEITRTSTALMAPMVAKEQLPARFKQKRSSTNNFQRLFRPIQGEISTS